MADSASPSNIPFTIPFAHLYKLEDMVKAADIILVNGTYIPHLFANEKTKEITFTDARYDHSWRTDATAKYELVPDAEEVKFKVKGWHNEPDENPIAVPQWTEVEFEIELKTEQPLRPYQVTRT